MTNLYDIYCDDVRLGVNQGATAAQTLADWLTRDASNDWRRAAEIREERERIMREVQPGIGDSGWIERSGYRYSASARI